ncbi:MAG: Wzz/FepE/Etk N-terminal domain-containing protein [Candidatus Berkelbacteria bacterium]
MELRDYFKMISKYKVIFWLIVLLCGASAFLWTKAQPKSYLASTTFTVNKSSSLNQKEVAYYLYDNYYNVQSAALFSQIVTTWFESPSLVTEVYQKAGIAVPPVSQKKLSKTFKAVREEPATINISLTGTNKDELDKLINAAGDVLQEKTNELSRNGEVTYDLAKFTPVVSDNTPNLVLNSIIGLFAGLFLGAILILGVEYFKEEK